MVTNARAYYSPRAATGATGTRHSPLPPWGSATPSLGGSFMHNSGATRRGNAKSYLAVIASEAKQSMRQQESKSGLLRGACHRARIRATRWLAMTARCTFAFPRHHAPELCLNDPPKRGRGATPRGERGMPGARCTRSRAWCVVNTRVSHHGYTGSPGIPARNGFNGFLRALLGDRAFLPPSPVKLLSPA